MPSSYDQSPHEDDRLRREHEQPEVYSGDGVRAEQWQTHEDDARRRREWEEEGRRRMTEQRRQEQDGIIRRQREAEHAAQAARVGPSSGQNRGVTPAVPVSTSSVQYPGASASGSSGLITDYLQMPLESPTRCVISLGRMLS
jgi:STAM-binding protein